MSWTHRRVSSLCVVGDIRSCGKGLLARACVGQRGGALHGPIGVTEPMPHVVVHCRPMAPFPSVCPTFVEGSNV